MSQTVTYEIPLQEISVVEPAALGISFAGHSNHHSEPERHVHNGSLTERREYLIGGMHFDKNLLYLLGTCIGGFTVGLNDTATGANLPSMQEQYNLSYSVVSLVFLAGFSGYIVTCMLNPIFQTAIGTRSVLMIAGCFYAGGALVISFAPPFPVVAAGLVLMGLGGGAYEACMTSLDNSQYMNMVYASFGLGSLVAPFIAGSFARSKIHWNLYYWLPFSLALLTMLCHFFLFKHYVLPSDEGTTHRGTARTRFAQTSRTKITWIGATLTILGFAIFYIWLTTYLLDTKGFQPDTSRYHLSVFFAGMVSGRIFFSLPFIHIRERMGNTLLLGAFCGTMAVLWKADSGKSSWAAVALGGFFLGPNTPGILSLVSARVSPNLKETAVSIIIGMFYPRLGLIGATLGPVLFGVAAGKVGPQVFPGVVITLSVMSALVFWSIPPREKRD